MGTGMGSLDDITTWHDALNKDVSIIDIHLNSHTLGLQKIHSLFRATNHTEHG
jgi:hypothetical protein